MRAKKAIEQVSKDHGLTVEEVKEEMNEAIRAAKDNPKFKEVFGDKVPTPEEFIKKIKELL